MKVVSDFHIHSHYSRATSGQMNIEELSKFGSRKGLHLIGTGDFSHPLWNKELREKLGRGSDGIYSYNGMNFILTNEISLMYSQAGKGRKVHILFMAPDFEVVDQINDWLKKKGRVDYDGRPIFGMSCPEFAEKIMEISGDNFIVPAHCMTPWFGIFGSMSGFDSVEECFQDQTKNIHALETGLSADPSMLWRISSLDKFSLISNSDSHSPWPSRIGRECNVFELGKLSYKNIISSIKEKDPKKFLYTIEVDPSYGKYHVDGHRACGISMMPHESIKLNNICPICKKPLTIGVLHRIEELADRPDGYVQKNSIPFKKLLPLAELIAGKYKTSPLSKKAVAKEAEFIEKFGSELNVLLDVPGEELEKVDKDIAELIIKDREEKLEILPGYDGVYGIPIINSREDAQEMARSAAMKETKPMKKPSKKTQEKKNKSLSDY
jgi:uncharacterized protein (TIGR00375 family)